MADERSNVSADDAMAVDDEYSDFRPPQLPEGVKKEIVKEADSSQWRHPKKGDELTVHYVATLEDGTKFDSSRDRGQPINFELGAGKVIKGWEKGIPTMKKGEIAKLFIQPEFAYGEAGSPPTIPPNAVLIFEVELISWVAKDDVFRDGGVVKSLVKEGEGWETPKKGEEVRCNIKATTADGEVLLEKTGYEVVMGECNLEPPALVTVFDKVMGDMKVEEKCSLAVSEDYIFEGKGKVTLELELEAIYDISDVSTLEDKTIMKKKVSSVEKEYSKPHDDVNVTLKVEAATDGSAPLPGFSGPKEIKFVSGRGEACDALECAASQMTKGERAIVTCTAPSKCSDKLTGIDKIDAKQVVFTLELVDFGARKEMHAMHGEEKLELALQKKEEAGELFKKKRFEMALRKYNKVTEICNNTDSMSKDCKKEAEGLKHVIDMNKAAVYLQLGEPTRALAVCNTILKVDRNNTKVLLRRAKAHFSRHEHAEALKDLDRVLELAPDNTEAAALIPQVKRAQKVVDKESKGAFSNMFKAGGNKGLFGKEKENVKPVKKEEPKEEEVNKDIVSVHFKLDHKITPGEQLWVTGAAEALGAWDVSKGLQLKRAPAPPDYEAMALGKAPKESHLWEAFIDIPEAEGRSEYHYHVKSQAGDQVEGAKHVMQLSSMGGSRVKCVDKWRERLAVEPPCED